MKRRAFLRALAALPIVAALAPLVPAPVARVFRTGVFNIGGTPAKKWRYLRVGLDLASDRTVTSVVMGSNDGRSWTIVEQPEIVVKIEDPDSLAIVYDEWGNEWLSA